MIRKGYSNLTIAYVFFKSFIKIEKGVKTGFEIAMFSERGPICKAFLIPGGTRGRVVVFVS